MLKFENGTSFFEQNTDELDKNHRENDDTLGNQGRMYERQGKILFLYV